MKQPLILALDIGTSSVRAALYDSDAKPLRGGSVKIEHSLHVTADGGSEIDADEAFAQVVAAIDAVLEKTSKLDRPIGFVAASSFWHSLVGIDADGRPTTKVLGWADTRSRKYTDILRKRFDETETHNRTGARFHSSFWPAKLSWIRKEWPEAFTKTERWLSLCDYIALKLFGEAVTSVSMASGTGIFDQRNCTWDTELFRYLELGPSQLPRITAADSETFSLINKYAKRWPRLADARWFPSVADGAADNIGAGCTTKTRATLMVGTSGAMRVAYEGEPPDKIPPGLWCYRVDRKRVLLGGALSDGGGLYHWLKQTLKLPPDAEAEIAKRPPGTEGLTFLPFLAGERSTGYHESAKGAVVGLRTATTSIDILQSAFESVAFRFAEVFDQLRSVVKVKEIVASGGALRESPVWTQIIADVLGHDLTMNIAHESSSRGAVLLALESIGKIDTIDAPFGMFSDSVKANRTRNEQYHLARKKNRDIYDRLIK